MTPAPRAPALTLRAVSKEAKPAPSREGQESTKALGLTIPPAVLAWADQVIQ